MDQPSVLLSGYLFKKGHFVKNWKKRWFVLDTSGVLSYYKKKEDKIPVGKIILDNATLFIQLDQLGVMIEVPTNSQTFTPDLKQTDVLKIYSLQLNKDESFRLLDENYGASSLTEILNQQKGDCRFRIFSEMSFHKDQLIENRKFDLIAPSKNEGITWIDMLSTAIKGRKEIALRGFRLLKNLSEFDPFLRVKS